MKIVGGRKIRTRDYSLKYEGKGRRFGGGPTFTIGPKGSHNLTRYRVLLALNLVYRKTPSGLGLRGWLTTMEVAQVARLPVPSARTCLYRNITYHCVVKLANPDSKRFNMWHITDKGINWLHWPGTAMPVIASPADPSAQMQVTYQPRMDPEVKARIDAEVNYGADQFMQRNYKPQMRILDRSALQSALCNMRKILREEREAESKRRGVLGRGAEALRRRRV